MSNDEEPDGYVYSKDGEEFEGELFETRDDARLEALAEYQDEIDSGEVEAVYTAKAHKLSAGYFAPHADQILEMMHDQALDEVGPEIVDDWPPGDADDMKALQERIGKAIDEWADEHGAQPRFFKVTADKRHAIDEGGDHDDEE